MLRIFKFHSYNEGEQDLIRFIDESEIEKRYNVYGYFRENTEFEEQLIEYREERNREFQDFKDLNEKKFDLADVKKFIENFQDHYYYDVDGLGYYGRPQMFVDPQEEDFVSSLDGWYDEDGTALEDADIIADEVVQDWDGSNWRTTTLTSETWEVSAEEITDEYEGIQDRWIEISSTRETNSTAWQNYFFDEETGTVWGENISMWQGHVTNYNILDGSDREYAFAHSVYFGNDEAIRELFEKELSESVNLKKGESLSIDKNAICFTYKNEEYHYSFSEIRNDGSYSYYTCGFYIDIDLDVARDAIRKRRIEAVTDRFARNNYSEVTSLPLSKIFVEYEDSIDAGNCEEISICVKSEIQEELNISGDFALRADVLINWRDDNYSRRAILQAYRNHYVKL